MKMLKVFLIFLLIEFFLWFLDWMTSPFLLGGVLLSTFGRWFIFSSLCRRFLK